MSTKMKVMMPCDEAGHVCDKTQYKEATLWEKIKLNIHLIYCRACREHTKNNAKLTKSINTSKVECMDKASKESLKENFDKALKEQ